MKFQRIVFMQGDEAREALHLLETNGEQFALDHLKQWDYDENETETSLELPHGTADKIYRFENYVMSYNKQLDYIGLVRVAADDIASYTVTSDKNDVILKLGSTMREIQIPKKDTNETDMFKLKCRLCQHEFPYDRNEHYAGPTAKYPDDWHIDCPNPNCTNWEEVGNNNPDSFEILQRGEDFIPETSLEEKSTVIRTFTIDLGKENVIRMKHWVDQGLAGIVPNTTRRQLYIMIDLEDTAIEDESWLLDSVALENTIRDRLQEAETATVHSISVMSNRTYTFTEEEAQAVNYAIQDRIDLLENGGDMVSNTELFEGELAALKSADKLIN
jgi:hypothetical protein